MADDNKHLFLISMISGAAAGVSCDIAFFPIDTIKTRIQAKGGFFHNGGWKGIYRGLGSITVASAPSAALFFVSYEGTKVYLNPVVSKTLPITQQACDTLTHMTAASVGEIVACAVRVPAEVIKQRTQVAHFNSSWETFRAIVSNTTGEGAFRGLYRGFLSTILRDVPFTVMQYPLYEYLKKKVAEREGIARATPGQGAVCGAIAGGVAAAFTNPLDVVKTRIMLHKEHISFPQMTRQLVADEGFGALMKGAGPRTAWISVGGAIFLGIYEKVGAILREVW